MRIISVLSFILLLSVYSFAESKDSVKNYYLEKSKAERFLIDSNGVEAIKTYKRAFKYKAPNALDLYNAFLLSLKTQDSASAKCFFNQLALHGLVIDTFERYGAGAKVKDNPFYKWTKTDYDSLYKIAANSGMVKYARVMDSLLREDNKVRGFHQSDEEVRLLLYTDSTNLTFLKNYIKQNGFPSYDRVGHFQSAFYGHFYTVSPLWFILWHTRHTSKMLNDILLEAVKSGDFDPDEFALLIDLQGDESIYYNALPRKFNDDGSMSFLAVSNEREVNERRSSIYLDSIELYKRKLIFDETGNTDYHLKVHWIHEANFAPVDLRSWEKMTK